MMFRPSFPHPFVLGRYHSSVFPDILASLARSNLHWTRHTASPTRNIPCNLLAAHRQRYKGRSSWEQLDRILYKHSYTLAETGTGYHTLLVSPIKQWISYPHTLVGVNSNSASQIFPILVSPSVHTHTSDTPATAYPYISHYNPPGFQPLCQFESSTLPDPASCV